LLLLVDASFSLLIRVFQDTRDHNPLIRALAIRTMSSIRVEEIVNYLVEPLRKAVKDDDPYVRKTAAISISKLHDVDPELVTDQGFLDDLRDMLADSNPMVVANAVAALTEIASTNPSAFELNEAIAAKLLAALHECTEYAGGLLSLFCCFYCFVLGSDEMPLGSEID
jgi:vesicle coat complex subunit